MEDLTKLHETDVEKWGIFLMPINVININNITYQCNNEIKMLPITTELLRSYKSKNKLELENYLRILLNEYDIDLSQKKYFIKLSTISGKDIINTDIDIDDWDLLNNDNKKLIMKNVEDLSRYLLSSERIALYIGDNMTANLCFREWIDFNLEEEFRCFIHGRKLVAISQYDYCREIPKHIQNPDLVVKCIKHFVDQIIQYIPFDNVVLDVALKFPELNVYFIEFNPFGLEGDTDSSLYDWVHDADLLSGENIGNIEKIDIRFFDMKYIERKYQI
jgi:hypothetical protein